MWQSAKPIVIGVAAYLVASAAFTALFNVFASGREAPNALFALVAFSAWIIPPIAAGAAVYRLRTSKPRQDAFMAGFAAPMVMSSAAFFGLMDLSVLGAVLSAMVYGAISGAISIAGVPLASEAENWAKEWPSPPPTLRQIVFDRPSDVGRRDVLSALAARLWLVAGPYAIGMAACLALKTAIMVSFLAISALLNTVHDPMVAHSWLYIFLGPFTGGFVAARFIGLRSFGIGFAIGLTAPLIGVADWPLIFLWAGTPPIAAYIGFGLLGGVLGMAGSFAGWTRADRVASRPTPPPHEPAEEALASGTGSRRRAMITLGAVLGITLIGVFAMLNRGSNTRDHGMLEGPATVIKGDTLKIDGQEIRLAFIDAPALRQTCMWRTEKWSCGVESARKLEALIGRETVRCLPAISSNGITEYFCDVLSGYAYGDRTLNVRMVEYGFAFAAVDKWAGDGRNARKIKEAERAAKAAGRGIWADPSAHMRR